LEDILETIISNDYTPFDNEESEMTLLMGARCVDGVVLIGDRRLTQTLSSGTHYVYDDKITGEIDGILTGFAGDYGAFEVFRTKLKDYVTTVRNDPDKKNTGPSFDQFKLKVSEIQHEFYNKYQQHQYRVLMGVSSKYFTNKKSSLYLYESDGRCFPQNETLPIAIGSGSPHVLYFLKRYWNPKKTTMKDFAQLADFLIRYVNNTRIALVESVGLNPDKPYPQIVFIPDKPAFCRPNNNGRPKLDCTPLQQELDQYKINSERKLKSFQDQDF
jgi:20S proteasome alpha/beta subunit